MEELKLLVQMVASLPTLAIWVVVAFYAYKVTVVGSIYGVIRFVALKIHDWAVTRKTLPPQVQEIHFADIFHGVTIQGDETYAHLIRQIKRVVGKGVNINSEYIHKQSAHWLEEAIDEKIAKDKAEKESQEA